MDDVDRFVEYRGQSLEGLPASLVPTLRPGSYVTHAGRLWEVTDVDGGTVWAVSVGAF